MPTAKLHQIHADIDARVADIRQGQPDWPCAKGCDRCCRSLADWPQLTAAEWELLKTGLATLPADQLAHIQQTLTAAGPQPPRPVTCPLLDQTTGACPVYAYRPVACRSYGYYVQRGIGLYCDEIRDKADAGHWPAVLWGNHDALDRQLANQGEVRSLFDWFETL